MIKDGGTQKGRKLKNKEREKERERERREKEREREIMGSIHIFDR